MTHPTLYKRTSTGAIQTWRIDVEGSTLIATYGQKGGKLQTARDTITVGKNLGKTNETTPEQQAALEARSQWERKAKKGYVQNVDDASSGTVDADFIAGGVNPMLAHSFAKQGHKIVYPAHTQPKLDGHRCIATRRNGVWTLWSRTRKPITGVPHIVKALDAIRGDLDLTLDGELYNHAYRDKFEELTSFIKQVDPKDGHEAVQYHVYDLVNHQPFSVRVLQIRDLIGLVGGPDTSLLTQATLIPVYTQVVSDEDEAMEAFAAFTDQGYEGSMLRNSKSLYAEKRSSDLQKVKEFLDDEFEIINIEEGRGRMAGKAIFVCKTPHGPSSAGDPVTFNVKMKGTLDSLTKYLIDPGKWIGGGLTVQYQGLTAAGIPRFPIGLRIREDI